MSTVLELIASGGSRPEGLLFHGTAVDFDGKPRPGGYDGVLWTADCPTIAQTYIARSGIQIVGCLPLSYEMDKRIVPDDRGFWHSVARSMGNGPAEVEHDDRGRLTSWRLPTAWPTYAEAKDWLIEQGYAFDANGMVKVSSTIGSDHDGILPSDYTMPGRLFIAPSHGLNLFDASHGESDLTDLQYHRLEMFRDIERQGYDGVVIDDFLQDEHYGNVGHRSKGLFASAAERLEWIDIPAVRRNWSTGPLTTAEYDDLLASTDIAPSKMHP